MSRTQRNEKGSMSAATMTLLSWGRVPTTEVAAAGPFWGGRRGELLLTNFQHEERRRHNIFTRGPKILEGSGMLPLENVLNLDPLKCYLLHFK